MKLPKLYLQTLSLLVLSFTAYGQANGPVAGLFLQGKWNAECAMEVVDHATIQSSELCVFVKNPEKKSQASAKDVEMDFGTDSLTLNQNGTATTVPYSRNPNTHAFSFTLNGKSYTFRVFLYHNQRIIEDTDGLVLVLTKVE